MDFEYSIVTTLYQVGVYDVTVVCCKRSDCWSLSFFLTSHRCQYACLLRRLCPGPCSHPHPYHGDSVCVSCAWWQPMLLPVAIFGIGIGHFGAHIQGCICIRCSSSFHCFRYSWSLASGLSSARSCYCISVVRLLLLKPCPM